MSHDIDIILNYEQQKKANKKKRKRKRKAKSRTSLQCSETGADKSEPNGCVADEVIHDEPNSAKLEQASLMVSSTNTASGNHRAGFDAFMTGFVMATYYQRFKVADAATFAESIPDFMNKLNLSGKDIPLKVEKSRYCKTSANHSETWQKVMATI